MIFIEKIAFFFKHGRFPGSQKLITLPQIKIPSFLRTDMPVSPIGLFKKFAGTDAKALVSFQALAALNIYLGGNKDISKNALNEYLRNLTFQALSQENDNIYMIFDHMAELVNNILESLLKIENQLVKDSVLLGENLKKQLKTHFQTELSPELKIQEDLVKYKQGKIQLPELIESVSSSTPLKTEEIKKSL